MIKASELRIGNLLRCFDIETDSWCVDSVAQIYPDDIITKDEVNSGTIANEKYEYLPLTEEWLLKFGFTKENRNRTWEIWRCIDASFIGFSMWVRLRRCTFPESGRYHITVSNTDVDLRGYEIGKEIWFVHQLQNLYFALTGEELTIDGNNQ